MVVVWLRRLAAWSRLVLQEPSPAGSHALQNRRYLTAFLRQRPDTRRAGPGAKPAGCASRRGQEASRRRRGLVLVGPVPPPHTGQSVAFQIVIDGFSKCDLDVCIVDIASRATARRDGSASVGRVLDYLVVLWSYVRAVCRPTQAIYVTIAQSRLGGLRDLLMVAVARLAGHRIVLHLHGGNFGTYFDSLGRGARWLTRSYLRRAAAVIVLAECLKSQFLFDGLVYSRLRVVHNAAADAPGADCVVDRQPPGSGPVVVLYMSNLIASKGYLDVLDAASILASRHPGKFRFEFCGAFMVSGEGGSFATPEDAAADFRTRTVRADLAGCVVYRGVVTGAEKRALLSKAHVMVLPTYYENEGEPICLIEAMSWGLVSVVTRHRAIPELMGDEGAVYVEAQRPCEVARALERLAVDTASFKRHSGAARARYLSRHTTAAHVRALGEVLGIEA